MQKQLKQLLARPIVMHRAPGDGLLMAWGRQLIDVGEGAARNLPKAVAAALHPQPGLRLLKRLNGTHRRDPSPPTSSLTRPLETVSKKFQKTVLTSPFRASSVPIRNAKTTIETDRQHWNQDPNPSADKNGSPEIRTQDQSVKSQSRRHKNTFAHRAESQEVQKKHK
jgi:hypothetical protein